MGGCGQGQESPGVEFTTAPLGRKDGTFLSSPQALSSAHRSCENSDSLSTKVFSIPTREGLPTH